MNYGSKILDDMAKLIELFEPYCEDRTTLSRIKELLADSSQWPDAHSLFSTIRGKTNEASSSGDRVAECQYLFEEFCAKTLYNLSRESAPFDPDSPYWIIPNALSFARRAGIPDTDCIEAIMQR